VLKKLGVSRSGYRAWSKRVPSNTAKRRAAVKERIQSIHKDSKQIYGAPKITKELLKEGEIIAERTVGKYMRELGIKAIWVKPWTITTRDSDFSNALTNILNRDFNPEHPNAVWVSDMTYVWTAEGFVYLTSIMDLYSRKIISWVLSKTMDVSCVVDAINMAKSRRSIANPLVMHSDRGSVYISKEYKKVTANMSLSYSAKASPWDNACIEAFHSLIKREWLHRYKITNFDHARQLVFEYIETFYNTVRTHSYCGYMSPSYFEELYYKQILAELSAA
jgi:transposase InsO family protein